MFSNEHFAFLAEKNMDTVFRVAYSYTKNRADAEDVTQDVLIQLYRTDKVFESETHLKHWLIRVTVNQCKMLFRAPWRRSESIEDYAETLGFEQREYLDLFRAVMALEKRQRLAVYLFYYEGYSLREIAEITGESLSAVTTRLSRARAKLKDQLTEVYGYDGSRAF